MIRKNDTTRYHLCYLIVNDIREDKYDGLSHVAEHTLLIPSDIGLSFIARGYTCVNHVYLYFGSKTMEDLQEIDRKIMGGEIFTDENIRCAKSQVIEEIWRMRDKTAKFENLVSFVTEKRIQKSAIGDPAAVACIQIRDIANWFDNKRQRGQIYRFLYKDAHDMIMSSSYSSNSVQKVADIRPKDKITGADAVLYAVLPDYASTIQIYFQIPSLYSKAELVKKAFYEFCLQRKVQDSLGIEMSITDNYFDTDERYIQISLPWNHNFAVEDIGSMLRTAIISITSSEYQAYRNEFLDYISMVMNQHESNSEVMNAVKNTIIYSLPQVTLEDVSCVNQVRLEAFQQERIISMPLKVVVL